MNKIIEDYKKIVAGNEAGKNICFMSRGEYADPKRPSTEMITGYGWTMPGITEMKI